LDSETTVALACYSSSGKITGYSMHLMNRIRKDNNECSTDAGLIDKREGKKFPIEVPLLSYKINE
jgi:hypothetical protein